MNILMLSWRDTKNPKGGGAETVTHELLRRWAKKGHACTWFTSAFPDCLSEEVVDKIQIVRRCGELGVYYEAFKFLRGKKFDMVIDQVNTIPFFTPLYYSGKKIAFFHQLCEEIWFYETKFPVSLFGYVAEKMYLLLYRNVPALVVSESTKKNLSHYGFRKVFVMKDCIDTKPIPTVVPKEADLLIYVGRLKKSKRVHEIIKAFRIVQSKIVTAHLHIVGRGDEPYEKELKELSKGIPVTFHGYLNMFERNKLMTRAEAILVASVKEGWGLIVVEANAHGTPAIVYDVDGLRDSVRNGSTGIVVKENTPECLAAEIISYLQDKTLKKKLSRSALAYSYTFNWDESAKEVLNFVEKVVK